MNRALAIALGGMVALSIVATSTVSAAGDVEAGAAAYKQLKCAKCHGASGKGDGPTAKKKKDKMKMNDWSDAAVVADWTDEFLSEITLEGGKAVGLSKRMPKYAKKMKKRGHKIEDLVAFMREQLSNLVFRQLNQAAA